MEQRILGPFTVGRIGLGAMPMSVARSTGGVVAETQAMATIHAALDAGVSLIDTADAYTPDPADIGHNERLVARALACYGGSTDHVVVATKGGHVRLPGGEWGIDGSPEYLRRACDASLAALGVEAIDLYQHHRPDPDVPYAETLGALRELRDAGKIRAVGISNATVDQIRHAQEVLGGEGLASVQNQFSPRFRSSEPELDYCAAAGIAFLPWSPLGGMGSAAMLGSQHAAFAEVAAAHGVSPQRVCLAWHLTKAPVVIPIPGASRPETILDSAAAMTLVLSADELARLNG
jgi:aryl-alcohol dehydrogenase-like predicted oxidoreductase